MRRKSRKREPTPIGGIGKTTPVYCQKSGIFLLVYKKITEGKTEHMYRRNGKSENLFPLFLPHRKRRRPGKVFPAAGSEEVLPDCLRHCLRDTPFGCSVLPSREQLHLSHDRCCCSTAHFRTAYRLDRRTGQTSPGKGAIFPSIYLLPFGKEKIRFARLLRIPLRRVHPFVG